MAEFDPDFARTGPSRDFGVPDVVKMAVFPAASLEDADSAMMHFRRLPMHRVVQHVRFAARYHSLFARRETFPGCLEVTAETEDGVIIGVRHRELPIEAVQFHPESILSAEDGHGLKLMENAVRIGRAVGA